MPARDRVRRDEAQVLTPAGTEPTSEDPEQLVRGAKRHVVGFESGVSVPRVDGAGAGSRAQGRGEGAPRSGRSWQEERRVRAQPQHRRSAAVRRFAVPQVRNTAAGVHADAGRAGEPGCDRPVGAGGSGASPAVSSGRLRDGWSRHPHRTETAALQFVWARRLFMSGPHLAHTATHGMGSAGGVPRYTSLTWYARSSSFSASARASASPSGLRSTTLANCSVSASGSSTALI